MNEEDQEGDVVRVRHCEEVNVPRRNVRPDHDISFTRKIAYGTILVSVSFPMIFNRCFLCKSDTSEWYEVLWFVPFIMVFQFGWASVQISHLALIPELSSVPSSRATMNSLRYAFTVIANLSVYFALAWLLSESTGHSTIGPWDLGHFRLAGWLAVILGISVSFVFYAFTREPTNQRRMRFVVL
uniref:MFS_1_like domain-containing protein n=1 Tax=Caenorhabditis tropicalis TaxID=1561998 RepID=A0A1I7TIJ5_9PELO